MARKSIKKILGQFVVAEFLFALVTAFVLLFVFNLGIQSNLIYPASYPQQVAQEFSDSFQAGKRDVTYLPDVVDYLLLDTDNKKIETTSLIDQETITELTKQGQLNQGFKPFHQQQVMKIEKGEQTLFLIYQVTADFQHPWLRTHLPSAEMTLLLLLIMILIIGFLVILSQFAKKINQELQKILTVKDQLLVEDLSIETKEVSSIVEIQSILSSLYKMKEALTDSLFKEWRQKRQSESQLRALSHDIKTPVTLVSGNLELLEETLLDEEQENYVLFAQKGIQQINDYLDDLRLFSGLNDQSVEDMRGIDNTLLEELIGFAQQQGQLKKLAINVKQRDTLPERKINLTAFKKAYQNILVNAVEYSKEGDVLDVSFEMTDQFFEFIVRDRGEGFSEASLVYGTDEFYTEIASRTGSHFGLGLSIANKIVTDDRGELLLENVIEQEKVVGAKVIIRLAK